MCEREQGKHLTVDLGGTLCDHAYPPRDRERRFVARVHETDEPADVEVLEGVIDDRERGLGGESTAPPLPREEVRELDLVAVLWGRSLIRAVERATQRSRELGRGPA